MSKNGDKNAGINDIYKPFVKLQKNGLNVKENMKMNRFQKKKLYHEITTSKNSSIMHKRMRCYLQCGIFTFTALLIIPGKNIEK